MNTGMRNRQRGMLPEAGPQNENVSQTSQVDGDTDGVKSKTIAGADNKALPYHDLQRIIRRANVSMFIEPPRMEVPSCIIHEGKGLGPRGRIKELDKETLKHIVRDVEGEA
jgi:hypothetical protein